MRKEVFGFEKLLAKERLIHHTLEMVSGECSSSVRVMNMLIMGPLQSPAGRYLRISFISAYLLGPCVLSVLGICENSVSVLCSEACPWSCLKHPLETSPWEARVCGFSGLLQTHGSYLERIPSSTSQTSDEDGPQTVK